MPKKSTRLVVVTDGLLIQRLGDPKFMSDLKVIILDEVHERSVNIDILLALVPLLLRQRPDMKLIVMSATGDSKALKDFLQDRCRLPTADINLGGRPQELTHVFTEQPIEYYDDWIVDVISQLLLHHDPHIGGILAFCPGVGEIKQIHDNLKTFIWDHDSDHPDNQIGQFLEVIELYRDAQSQATKALDEKRYVDVGGQRWPVIKVILATNLAETSLTFPNLSHVIDCGFFKRPLYSPSTDSYRAQTYKCIVFHAYTAEDLLDRDEYQAQVPITRVDLTHPLFTLITHELVVKAGGGFSDIEYIMGCALTNLCALKFVDPVRFLPTPEAQAAAKLGLEPCLARLFLIAEGEGKRYSWEILLLIAVLQVDEPLYDDTSKEGGKSSATSSPSGRPPVSPEHCRPLAATEAVQSCRRLDSEVLIAHVRSRRHWEELCGSQGSVESDDTEKDLALVYFLLQAFPLNLARRIHDDQYRNLSWEKIGGGGMLDVKAIDKTPDDDPPLCKCVKSRAGCPDYAAARIQIRSLPQVRVHSAISSFLPTMLLASRILFFEPTLFPPTR
ncbi:putative ATP-dependent RNA helicase dhr2 [Apiotrichum porosum]|uniref:Putative ATP-dependent RNA helicase dhr2 n=1 Tax=Apiotrichum porosum TaxID=105984 RepID=A0A427XK15_9TREE|nr:putative ATP-dependent RNA helicase dhr2 [Apiotrichum porosum]RSH79097.1 putative ATP-dependent RNA helicase dhr2 [Apiotrichum porosum]